MFIFHAIAYSFSGSITYIISYTVYISCLISCSGYTPMLYFSFFIFILVLSYTFMLYVSYCTFHILYCHIIYFHMLLYCISCSCNCILSSHSSAMLLISYHILFTFPVHILFIFFYVHACEYLTREYGK